MLLKMYGAKHINSVHITWSVKLLKYNRFRVYGVTLT